MKDGSIEIQNIYNEYDNNIDNSTKQYEFEFKKYCFGCVLDWYPKLDYQANDVVYQERYEQMQKENYGILIERLWKQLEVEKYFGGLLCYQKLF